MLYQIVSVLGAGMVLLAYALIQTGRMKPRDASYALLNFFGASLLTWVAVVDRRLGFILLESVWAVLSVLPFLRKGPTAAPAPDRPAG